MSEFINGTYFCPKCIANDKTKTFIGKFIAKADEDNNFDDIIMEVSEIKKELKPFENYLKNDETSIKIITGTMLI